MNKQVLWLGIVLALVCVVSLPATTVNASESKEVWLDTADANYYAYLDLNSADEPLKTKILEARSKIIYSKSWVADGVRGRVRDTEGNIVEELPQFSELFPADWDIPVQPVLPVDESYYH